MLASVFGIGALVAIQSFRDNLEHTIDLQARSLVGADLVLSSLRPFPEEVEAWITGMGGEQAEEVRFRSMAWFPEQEKTRLVQVRGLAGEFPFYGSLDTEPAVDFRGAPEPTAVVDRSLMDQYGLGVGDTLRLGEQDFTIGAALLQVSGETGAAGVFAPRVYIGRQFVDQTRLLQQGSLKRFRRYFRFAEGLNEEHREAIEAARDGLFARERVEADTVDTRRRQIGRALDRLYNFLNLVAFVALLLGGFGVAGGVQIYLQAKLPLAATLRCVGLTARDASTVYLLQIVVAGLAGALIGVAFGVGIQFALPALLHTFLPFSVDVFLSWPSIFGSLVFGFLIALCCALLPLLRVRHVSPLVALRADLPLNYRPLRDPAFWAVAGTLALLTLGFCLAQTTRWAYGVGFAGALAGSMALLALLGHGLRVLLRRSIPVTWPYVIRQGLANLHRPRNRTLYLLSALGMGALLLNTLFLSRDMLIRELATSDASGQPNIILFDIQPDQVTDVESVLRARGLPIVDRAPIVTMRLLAVEGRSLEEIRNDKASKVDEWALNWEYRSTYRDGLTDAETLLEGEFTATTDGSEPIAVSIERSIAEELEVGVGDALTFDVQGIPLETRITSVREVNWAQIRANFYMVFPTGILEEAPATWALVSRSPDRAVTAGLQESLVQRLPNVSTIDLSLVLETVTSILDRVTFVIQFMAGFTVATGLAVLAGSIVTGRYARIQESTLLRTLGASGATVRRILAVEYACLGLIGATAGGLLAIAASWPLAFWVFEVDFSLSPWRIVLVSGSIMVLTLLAGLFSSRGIASHPPLAVLRSEGR